MIYNWWTLFVRRWHSRTNALKRSPAVHCLLHGVAIQTGHGGQTRLTVTGTHAKRAKIPGGYSSIWPHS
jgi:hypothetical protein